MLDQSCSTVSTENLFGHKISRLIHELGFVFFIALHFLEPIPFYLKQIIRSLIVNYISPIKMRGRINDFYMVNPFLTSDSLGGLQYSPTFISRKRLRVNCTFIHVFEKHAISFLTIPRLVEFPIMAKVWRNFGISKIEFFQSTGFKG